MSETRCCYNYNVLSTNEELSTNASTLKGFVISSQSQCGSVGEFELCDLELKRKKK